MSVCAIYHDKGWCPLGTACKLKHENSNPITIDVIHQQLNALLGIQSLVISNMAKLQREVDQLKAGQQFMSNNIERINISTQTIKKELNQTGIPIRINRDRFAQPLNSGSAARASHLITSQLFKRNERQRPPVHLQKASVIRGG